METQGETDRTEFDSKMDEPAESVQPAHVDEEGQKRQEIIMALNEALEEIDSFQKLFTETGEADYLRTALRLMVKVWKKFVGDLSSEELVDRITEFRSDKIWHFDSDLEGGWSTDDDDDDDGDSGRIFIDPTEYYDRYKRSRRVEDLEKAIEVSQELLEILGDSPMRGVLLTNLSCYLIARYDRCGTLDDLTNGISRAEEAVSINHVGDPHQVVKLENLGNHYYTRYERLGTLEDLELAVKISERTVEITPMEHPERAMVLVALSNILSSRYECFGNLGDLEEAIKRGWDAVAATPEGDPNRAGGLEALSRDLGNKYQRLGRLEDLQAAIEISEQAARASPSRVVGLTTLSNLLALRFRRLGDLEDIEKAIKRSEEAVALIETGDTHSRAAVLHSLSGHISERYKKLGTLEDLEKAIRRGEEAVLLTDAGHPARPARLASLSNHIYFRYNRLRILDDLDRAINGAEEAIAATPADDPHRAGILSNLSHYLRSRNEQSGNIDDLQKAIQRGKEAVALTPVGHPDRAGMLNNLGSHLGQLYQQSLDIKTLGQAIDAQNEALALTPAEHPHRGPFLLYLGTLLIHSSDMMRGVEILQDAWCCTKAGPTVRIKAACNAASVLYSLGRYHESSCLLEDAVKLLPTMSQRFLDRDDQQHQLSDFPQLAANAAAMAFSAGKEPSHCLKLLELSRGIILGLAIDCRSDLLELQLEKPEAFKKLDRLRTELDSPFTFGEDTYEQNLERRKQVVRDLDETLAYIRQEPGFEGFQLPPTSEMLMSMASEGPIITITCTRYRSDAIIVSNLAVKALPLPGLEYQIVNEKLRQLRADILQGRNSTYPARNGKLRDLLLWLWDIVVEPVCHELQLHPIPDGCTLPRIWWIGVGPLATVPFHAAGDHTPGSTRNVLSRAISSYIPTIKALSYARERRLELLSRQDSKLLMVTMPKTPGHCPLKATEEVRRIGSVVSGRTDTEILERPDAVEVLEKLKSCQAVHFSCHGVPSTNPSNSHLLLYKNDGSDLGITDPLTTGAIASLNMRQLNAQIAYLSACSTAVNRSNELVNESIHIASGFQLAGFSHVLATLWKAEDRACQDVAVEFYRSLFDGQGGGHQKVGYAFHHAVKKLRDSTWRQPIRWASFIHTGA